MERKNIIFDLDGTLWDSTTSVVHAWNEVLEKNNLEKVNNQTLENCFGKTFDEINEIVFKNNKNGNKLLNECLDNEIPKIKTHGGTLYEGTINTIKTLSNKHNLYIVSNCQSGYIEAFLDYYDLNKYFIDYECEGNTKKNKAINIAHLMKRNNITDKNTYYIGDTTGDFLSATENNIPFIHASYGFNKNIEGTYKVIKEITELLNIFEN